QSLASGNNRGELTQVMERVVQSKPAVDALVAAAGPLKLNSDSARLALRVARSGGRKDLEPLAKLLEKNAQSGPAIPVPTTLEAMKTLVDEVNKMGDPARGELVFRRNELNCYKCHGIGPAGGLVGPNLQSLGASSQPDYIIDSILQPAKAVKEGYNAVVVAMNDGRILTGIPIGQSPAELIIRDAEGKELKLPKAQIDDQKPTGSLMPAGLIDSLTRQELLDLLRFLTELGKVGPYSLPKERIIRHYESLAADQNARTGLARISHGGIARGDQPGLSWAPLYATVAGSLRRTDLPVVSATARASAGFARFAFNAQTEGTVELKLNSAKGLQLWLDGVSVAAADVVKVSVKPGRHVMTLALDPATSDENLSVHLLDSGTSRIELPSGP
ncbi:MAG: sorbosone dehydrogenase, partial [bacterium]